MAQDKTRLPEGTDKIISGTSEVIVEETMVVESTVVDEDAPTGAGSSKTGLAGRQQDGTMTKRNTGGAGQGKSTAIMDKVRSGSEKLSGQAADKARGFVGQGLERSSEALTSVGRLVNDTAEGIDERLGQEYGDYARRAAEAIEDTARKLASKNPDELIDDTRSFVRKSPGIALAGAAIIGFALARLVKTGLDAANGNRDDDDGASSGGKASR